MDLSKEELKQYSRHIKLKEIGLIGQLKLKAAKVLVIGAGGLGSPILQYLAAAGIGTLAVIDGDVVDQSNLQRQVLYTHHDIGVFKVNAAKEKLQALNPYIKIITYPFELDNKNAIELFKAYDIIVDGSDNFPTRYLVNDAAVIANKPLVFGSIYKFEGQVSVFNYKNGPTYRCIFPTPPLADSVPNCAEVGVLGVLPGMIGNFQANEVLKILLDIGEVLSGKILTYNTLTNKQFVIKFDKNPEINVTALQTNYQEFCGIVTEEHELSYPMIKNKLDEYLLIDVREDWEHADFNIGGINISLYELEKEFAQINTDKPILLYCESGNRSNTGKQFLDHLLKDIKVYTLKGGIQTL
ncbi:dinucleotide-utilizing protein [Putridiphycobacter roseus]|uniref:Molybdopterin-synthase adenylyltransferase n=1 Tax=Putridiphycobacter roseus TaxID=2219161 RepID=A0A2W1NE42_9FLAO|nr:HesA/MoeB/ThiF family protein [Putridiphycobacter roseus]PZE16336.1 dinucleotide-utilizing protein [Putridiphycobacter roseus]